MHLTVVFLGSQPLDRVGSLEHRLVEGAARTAPFELSLGRIGSFGRSGAPQVLWVEAVERSGALARLQDDLGAGFRSAGVELEAKPFRPHITLGRARGRRRGIELVATEPPRSTHRADRVTLFRSDLGQSGPTYTALAQAGLGAQV
jgi:2'-5' RNA ligase